MNIELPKEVRAQAVASIERWFKENADEPIGNIQAAALLNFFVAEIAPSVYNQAIADAQQRLQQRVGRARHRMPRRRVRLLAQGRAQALTLASTMVA